VRVREGNAGPVAIDTVDSDDGQVFDYWAGTGGQPDEDIQQTRSEVIARLICYAVPTLLGDIAVATGDYAEALRGYVYLIPAGSEGVFGAVALVPIGAATFENTGVYQQWQYAYGDRPFSYFREGGNTPIVFPAGSVAYTADLKTPSVDLLDLTHPLEIELSRFRRGNAMGEWADELYRSDEPANVARAANCTRPCCTCTANCHRQCPRGNRHWCVSARPTRIRRERPRSSTPACACSRSPTG